MTEKAISMGWQISWYATMTLQRNTEDRSSNKYWYTIGIILVSIGSKYSVKEMKLSSNAGQQHYENVITRQSRQ